MFANFFHEFSPPSSAGALSHCIFVWGTYSPWDSIYVTTKGDKIDVYIHSSNVIVTSLNTDDKWRIKILEKKPKSKIKSMKADVKKKDDVKSAAKKKDNVKSAAKKKDDVKSAAKKKDNVKKSVKK